jgi:hypothetical protein
MVTIERLQAAEAYWVKAWGEVQIVGPPLSARPASGALGRDCGTKR